MEILEAAEHERETHVVWVDEAAKVASFHEVEGYERHIFANHAFLWIIFLPYRNEVFCSSELY